MSDSLKHYGVKGMHWGIRRGVKLLASGKGRPKPRNKRKQLREKAKSDKYRNTIKDRHIIHVLQTSERAYKQVP